MRPRIARSCAVARAWSPGLPMPLAVEVGDLVGADHDRVGVALATALRLREGQARRRSRPAPRRAAGARRPRAARRRTAGAGARAARAGSARSRRGRGGGRASVIFHRRRGSFGRALNWADGFLAARPRPASPRRRGVRRGRRRARRRLAGGSPDAAGRGHAGAGRRHGAARRRLARERRAARRSRAPACSRRCSVGADTDVTLECQRCLQPMRVPLHAERRIFFVEGEDAAAALDAESDDDVLALTPALDLAEPDRGRAAPRPAAGAAPRACAPSRCRARSSTTTRRSIRPTTRSPRWRR